MKKMPVVSIPVLHVRKAETAERLKTEEEKSWSSGSHDKLSDRPLVVSVRRKRNTRTRELGREVSRATRFSGCLSWTSGASYCF